MSWIGLTDRSRSLFNPAGLGADKARTDRQAMAANEILPTGTLMIETRFLAPAEGEQDVLVYTRVKGWRRHLRVSLTGAGDMQVTFVQGTSRFSASLRFPVPDPDTPIRLYYSWNSPERRGRLVAELVESSAFHVAPLSDPLPMPVLDALTIMRNGQATEIAPETGFVAVADTVEPVGPGAGICAGTPVETPSGAVPVERLRLGDRVVTATAGSQPVRWITRRTVPALGHFRPVRLRAPFFGLSEDLLLAPDHRILVTGAEAEYMLGQEGVLMPAGRLVGSHAALAEGRLKTVTYYDILLDRHDCLLHDTLWSESLYVGQIGLDAPRLQASALAGLPASAVPSHRSFARHRLTETEARSLASVLHR